MLLHQMDLNFVQITVTYIIVIFLDITIVNWIWLDVNARLGEPELIIIDIIWYNIINLSKFECHINENNITCCSWYKISTIGYNTSNLNWIECFICKHDTMASNAWKFVEIRPDTTELNMWNK